MKMKLFAILFTFCILQLHPSVFCQANNQLPPQVQIQQKSAIIGKILLKKSIEIDQALYFKALKTIWSIIPVNIVRKKDSFSFEVGKFKVLAKNFKKTLPADVLKNVNKNNSLWPDVVQSSMKHKAYFELSLDCSNEDLFEANIMFSKLSSILLSSEVAISIHNSMNDLLIPTQFYINETLVLKRAVLPLRNWFTFKSVESNEFTNSYTFGFAKFGYKEIEIINSKKNAKVNEGILYNIASFVLGKEIILENAQRLNIDNDSSYSIYISPGVYSQGETVKVVVK